jgi:hypothetical protein
MLDTLTTITNFITSPPGQIAAGGVLAGIVWKFFERIEGILTDQTKLEIAVWLVGRKPIGPVLQRWPETFADVFDRVFGTNHLSFKCFWRSCVASYTVFLILFAGYVIHQGYEMPTLGDCTKFLVLAFVGNALPDYLSLLGTRWSLHFMTKTQSGLALFALLVGALAVTAALASADVVFMDSTYGIVDSYTTEVTEIHWISLAREVFDQAPRAFAHFRWNLVTVFTATRDESLFWFYPAFFSSMWLWLYAGSGFLLKAARRFDIGFAWFNRKFDIEHKPLSAIGLVAGAIVAVLWWAVVAVRWMV